MIIAVPTGIKIFSWLLLTLSKLNLASTLFRFSMEAAPPRQPRNREGGTNLLSLYQRFPRANRKYIKENPNCTALVPFGLNLSSPPKRAA